MKELSIKEKAKAYDEAIERAKKLYGNGIAEEIFPELKESDDEKIRKEIISILRNAYWTSNKNRFNELVACLEKQGKQLTDKNKLKFKVGDKIVNRVNVYMGDLSHQSVISEITEDKYILNDGGYIYFKDQDIWELAPDKKQRFDPKTLKPFDKVLVRDFAGTEWSCDLFSYIENIKSQEESFICTGGISFNFCIPYNDKTKYLVGTIKEAPEYYRYWEDRL